MKFAVLICFGLLLGVPFLFRPSQQPPPKHGLQLIIITPHNEQIRSEFARGFDAWHQKRFGRRVNVIYNVPGGTSEIRKMLEAQYKGALESGVEPGGAADLVFGGGSYEHDQLKKPITLEINGQKRETTVSIPIDFDQKWLDETYGPNVIGGNLLYDKQKYWFGVALSGFGIVYNRDALRELGANEPTDWPDLGDPKLQGAVALVNPGQSGSIKTTFETILQRKGWEQGWRILHRAGANARYFSGSSLKPPIDVTEGNAAVSICIDFYGRYQAQAMREAGDADRIGYIDPPGSTIDSDPITMLRGAPHAELGKRFIEFCLSDDGQALWQFHRRSDVHGAALGPAKFELRRLPIVRGMYARHFEQFIDRVNPFELASPIEKPDPNFRDFITPLFSAMVMDTHHELKDAWDAIISHPAYPKGAGKIVSADNVTDPTLRRMLELFDAMPTIAGPNAAMLSLADVSKLGEVRNGWAKGKWADQGLWDAEASPVDEMRKRFGRFFRANYREIVDLAKGRTAANGVGAAWLGRQALDARWRRVAS